MLKKNWPIFIVIAAALFLLRGPLFLGKSFSVVESTEYLPWSAMGFPPVPSNQACNDQIFAHYPRKALYHEFVRDGRYPRWDSRLMGGYPVGADPHNGVFDPFNLLFAALPIGAAHTVLGLLQLVLSGIFTFLFLREIGLSKLGSAFGAVAFMTQPFFITHLTMPTNVQSALWLPALLWATERALKSDRPFRYTPLIALFIALSILGGFPPTYILVLTSWLVYSGASVLLMLSAGAGKRSLPVARTSAAICVALILGVMLSAVQLLPTWRLSGLSERTSIEFEEMERVALPPAFLLTLANPYLIGRPNDGGFSQFAASIRPPATQVASTSYMEDNHYVGWAVMLLAVVALRYRWRDRKVMLVALLALSALLILYGTPLLTLAYHLIPGFKASRHDRVIFVWGSAMAFLAAFGLDELSGGKISSRFAKRMLVCIALLSALMVIGGFAYTHFTGQSFLAGFVRERAGAWHGDMVMMALIAAASAAIIYLGVSRKNLAPLLMLLAFIEAGIMSARFLTFQPVWFPDAAPPSIAYLTKHAKDGRIARIGKPMNVFPSNAPLVWGISDAQGRNALTLKHWGKYFNVIEQGSYWRSKKLIEFSNPDSLRSPLLNAAGVKYVLSDAPLDLSRQREGQFELKHSGDLYIYENHFVYPEAWIASEASFVRNEDAALGLVSAVGFDPSRKAVIEGTGGSAPGTGGKAIVIKREPERVEVTIPSASSGWLVLADAWYPEWQAEVDGKPRSVFKADEAFMAVEVGLQDRIVVFKFVDRFFRAGIVIASVGAFLCLIIWLIHIPKSRRAG